MFEINVGENDIIFLKGRFDAAQVETAKTHFENITKSCTLDFAELTYISSAGLGVLIATYQRLNKDGHKIKLRNMTKLVRDVFKFSRLDTLFEIE